MINTLLDNTIVSFLWVILLVQILNLAKLHIYISISNNILKLMWTDFVTTGTIPFESWQGIAPSVLGMTVEETALLFAENTQEVSSRIP